MACVLTTFFKTYFVKKKPKNKNKEEISDYCPKSRVNSFKKSLSMTTM